MEKALNGHTATYRVITKLAYSDIKPTGIAVKVYVE